MKKYFSPVSAILGAAFFFSAGGFGDAAGADEQEIISFFMDMPRDALALTHGGKIALKPFPEGIITLQDSEIANSLALTVRLRDKEGGLVGLASELEDFPVGGRDDGKLVWDTYWTILILGRGSLLLYERESLGPDVGKVFAETPGSGKDWVGQITQPSNVGPHPSGHGIIVGGTGEFSGATGTFQEIGTLKRFTITGEIEADIELRIHLDR